MNETYVICILYTFLKFSNVYTTQCSVHCSFLAYMHIAYVQCIGRRFCAARLEAILSAANVASYE